MTLEELQRMIQSGKINFACQWNGLEERACLQAITLNGLSFNDIAQTIKDNLDFMTAALSLSMQEVCIDKEAHSPHYEDNGSYVHCPECARIRASFKLPLAT